MSSPGFPPRNNKPAATPAGNQGLQLKLRVPSLDGTARTVAPSIAMPQARTELRELLAGDSSLCVQRRASAIPMRPNADAGPGASGSGVQPQAESPATFSGRQGAETQNPPPRAAADNGDLACVIDAWPALSRNIRAAICAMIREATCK